MDAPWILLADDDLEDQEMLIDMIRQVDDSLPIETVSDGHQALEKLSRLPEEEIPSLIVLDYKMPYLSAAEVLEALARDPRYAAVPKVVWSTSHREEDVRRCIEAGASEYFEKPATTAELRSIAGKMLEYRNMEKFRNAESHDGK